jgi:hypothetical protein
MGWDGGYPVEMSKVGSLLHYGIAYLGLAGWIYTIPTHDMHQWMPTTVYVLLMMDAVNVRNM